MIKFTFNDALVLTSLFLLMMDDLLSETIDLPEKSFLLGAQLLQEQIAPGTKIDVNKLVRESEDVLEELRLKHYWNVQNLADTSRNRLMQVLTQGRADGLTPGQIAKELNTEVFGKYDAKALLVARTYVTEAETLGRIANAEKMVKEKGLKDAYLIAISAPDACPLCKTYLNYIDGSGKIIEGKIFPVSFLKEQDSNLGKGPKDVKPNIPMHFNCRCVFQLTTERQYLEQQEKLKKGELKARSLSEVTAILKAYDPDFEKTLENVSLEKAFEISNI